MQKKAGRAFQNQSSRGQLSAHFGRVTQLDTEEYQVRVRIDELDGVETFWLRTAYGVLPEVGALVFVILQAEGSGGLAIALNGETHNRRRTEYSDGTLERYEEGNHEVIGPTQSTVETDDEITAIAVNQLTLQAARIDLNP